MIPYFFISLQSDDFFIVLLYIIITKTSIKGALQMEFFYIYRAVNVRNKNTYTKYPSKTFIGSLKIRSR